MTEKKDVNDQLSFKMIVLEQKNGNIKGQIEDRLNEGRQPLVSMEHAVVLSLNNAAFNASNLIKAIKTSDNPNVKKLAKEKFLTKEYFLKVASEAWDQANK